MKQPFLIPTLSLLLIVWVGCTPSNRPPGLPKLYPASITLTQGGKPISDVSIQLIPKVESIWPVSGTTDANGTAMLVTYGQFPGAPEGSYTVAVSKTTIKSDKPQDEYTSGITEIFSLIEVEHTKPETSKLEMTVEKKPNSKTFELGEPVHILVDTIRPGT